ncbi:DUF1348 family protein [Breoghania sp. L-A4]|uniref:nuclear transport factor 2 family protein n=1 Tax=Breoghania sp. L-A4 TaxID=2304600 RepID=UPI000E35BE46|nr:DUF1348 family protein [Breoghania sp. L-A4]AXS39171.1 nuclear transport factor 2 family protein [Breoghania sp. L-A4]
MEGAGDEPPPFPPFTDETAAHKARLVEDAWNSRDPEAVSRACTRESRSRNRTIFLDGRSEIVAFLAEKWRTEREYRSIKELWAFEGNRSAVRFACEWRDDTGQWFRACGNESWELDDNGPMAVRHASINDVAIDESERLFHWPQGRRPDDHPSLSTLGL